MEKSSTLLAILCARVPLSLFNNFLSHALVASHMATCQVVSEKRDNIYVNYPSEPILAEGASYLWEKEFVFSKLLQTFETSSRAQALTLGSRGEFIGQTILLRSIDKAIFEHLKNKIPLSSLGSLDTRLAVNRSLYFPLEPFDKLIPVKDFLQNGLLSKYEKKTKAGTGTNPKKKGQVRDVAKEDIYSFFEIKRDDPDLQSKRIYQEGFVCFNHFSHLYDAPSIELIRKFAERCSAVVLPDNHKGSDLLIPVFFASPDRNRRILLNEIGVLLIQIKNKERQTTKPGIIEGLQPDSVWSQKSVEDDQRVKDLKSLPTLSIFMDLKIEQTGTNADENSLEFLSSSSPKKPSSKKPSVQRNTAVILIKGLRCYPLENYERREIKNILEKKYVLFTSDTELDKSWPVSHPRGFDPEEIQE